MSVGIVGGPDGGAVVGGVFTAGSASEIVFVGVTDISPDFSGITVTDFCF